MSRWEGWLWGSILIGLSTFWFLMVGIEWILKRVIGQ